MTLDEADVALFDCEHKTPVPASEGIPYITIPQMKDGRLDVAKARLVGERDATVWNRRVTPCEGDVILSRRTNPGTTAVVPPDLPCVLGQNLVILRSRGSKVYQPFLRWLTRSRHWWQEVERNLNVGAVFDSLRCADIPHFQLPFPPFSEQRAIAHILGTLDEKIELNQGICDTLEATTRALFKSWFVDFDPVRAKAGGRAPGLPEPLADLFPARFVDSDRGDVPEGWWTGTLLHQARLLSGGTPKTDVPAYWGGGIPWASAKDVSRCGEMFLVATERTITSTGLDKSATQIVPALSTVVVARGATTGRMVLLGRDMAMNQTCYALQSTTDSPFALHCRLVEEIDGLVHAAHGSVFDTVTTKTFTASNVVVAPPPVLAAFEERVAPTFQRILMNIEESRSLAALRDTLLPKLISGELRVNDAERLIGTAI